MKRRVLSLLLCALMVVQLIPGGLSIASAEATTVYSMASDSEIQDKAAGDTFEGTIWLQKAGSPTLTVVDNGSVKGISVTGRTQDWHCIDLKNLTTLPDGFDYTITVAGRTATGARMKLSQPSSPYGTHVSQDIADDGAFSLETTFTYAELQTERSVRIQSEGTTEDFTIDSIVITQTEGSGGVTPPLPPDDGATIEDITITFNDADNTLWGGAFSVSNTANAAVEWVSDFGNGDNYALKGTHLSESTDYTAAENAIRLTFDDPPAKNAIYTISYSVYVPAEGNEGKDSLVGPGIVLSNDYAGATGVTKFPSSPGTIDIGTWKEVNVTTPAIGLNETLKSIDFRFVVNDASRHPDVWYIDNISIKQELITVEIIEPDYEDYPALKDVYKDYFLIGTASGNSRMTGDKLDIINYHFNSFTPENEMKPSQIQNIKGIFTYDTLDQQLNKVSGLSLIGHTLAWHSQSPGWMWGTPDALSAEEAKANMDAHIESVLGRYGADLYSIDVVNEAFADGRNNADWRLNLRDSAGWYTAMGWEWVEHAFLKAAEIVDDNGWDCKLYYNDYNLDYADKATAVFNMVKDINERHAGERPNGKPLIEGIGMQAHYNQDTNPANVENSINLFSTLPDVAISVTELDITYTNSGSLSEQQLMDQAVKYAQLFDIYKENAAGTANGGNGRIERVTFWGTNDADSWRAAGFPLLFDRNLCAKEAFKAVLNPGQYISEDEIPPAGLNYDQYPALKDVYKDYFMVGTVGPLTANRSGLIDYHFNAYTPENEMKPQNVQNVKGTFTFDILDSLLNGVAALSGNFELIGHTLAWHSQSPNWMWDALPASYEQPGTFDRDTALANLNDHIDRVLGEYGEQLHSIDVVNEAVGTANPANWKASLEKGEGWCLALGWEWVELAFVKAAEVVDQNGWDCKLYYNDIGLDGAAKAQTVYEMVKDINERYAGTRPDGKPLIEGIGMQGHYNKNTDPENVENSIELFSTLPGVSVSFTEVDLEWLNTGSLTPQQTVAQAQKYAQLFQIFKKYAAGPANRTTNPKVIERVTLWGSNDGDSWKSAGFPLLFNAPGETDITAKEALVAVLDPNKYLEVNPVVDDPNQEEEKPIAGVYVYDTSKGDSWSGANIILGNDSTKWPWSTAGADGKVAFTPVKESTYRITVDYTSLGTNAIRIRWLRDESNNGYTAQDAQVVGTSPHNTSLDPSQVATVIPAYFNSGMSTGNSYTLVTEIKLNGSQPSDGLIGNIAIRGGAGGNSFSITGIKVERIDTGTTPKLLVNWPEGLPKGGIEGVHVYATDNGDSWSGANIIVGDNAAKWPWSTAGADGKVAFTPLKNETYRIAVNYTSLGTSAIRIRWLRDESNSGYTAQDAQVVGASPYNTSLKPSEVAKVIPAYFNSGMVSGGTYTLTTEVKLESSQPADGLVGNIAVRGGGGGNSFLINWIKVERIGKDGSPDKLLVNWPEGIENLEPEPEEPGIVIPPAGETYEKYPALKDVYKDYFSVGIFGRGEVNALIHNYASYAPGNEMKPESTQNVKGTFTYSSADNAFNDLTNRNPEMLFYGHTLAWHSQSPTWMWDAPPARYEQPGTFDRETALANLNNHIENVLGYYGGRLEGVDVVNEAIGTADPNDWKASLAKGEGWYMALGWEWVELAFLKAAEVVDSHPDWDCKLIYNDFGLNSPNKARAVYEMVKDINERYADVRPNGKPLIEVIGMQCHYNTTTDTSNVENSIALFATLPGVSVNITEMDVGCPPVGTLTPANENNQAMKFAELFRIFKKYAAGPANNTNNPKVITRVAICGVRDAITGWRAGEFALLFNSDGLAKQSLVAALDPEAFLAAHDYIEQNTEPAPEPVDGIHVYDTGRGDAYSGANIILGNDETQWPWSLADSDGKVAFTPEKDATYRLTFNYTSKGTSAIRIRWVKDNTNGGYTDADGAVVNDHQYSASQVSTTIPAYFNSGMVNSGSYTLTTEIKLDGEQPANGLIGNIAIRGGSGGSAYTINWIKVEKVGTGGAADELLVSWPKAPAPTKHKITAAAGAGGTITPSGETEVTSGESQTYTISANSSYSIANVLVDGVSVGAVSTYTFNEVTEDHTISATFNYTPAPTTDDTSSAPAPQPPSIISNIPTGDVPPANISNKPVKGTVVGTPKEALDNSERAFRQNPGFAKVSNPITLGAPPKANKGLTPVSIPIPAGTKFTAIVSPNADGLFTPVPTYTDKNGTVYVLINEAKTLIPVTINTVYNDVPESHWSAEWVRLASMLGIILGNGDTTFKPDATVTNQQTLAMLMRAIGFNAEYNSVLSTAVAKGVKSASLLSNNGYTSRASAAVIIKDILAALNVNVSLTEDEKASILAPFNDLEGLTEEEMLSIAVAIKYGILVGTYIGNDYSTMSPELYLTRSQLATISVRLVDLITK